MGLFAYIEKLVNEHGSSAILRERIALLEQQHQAESRKNQVELSKATEQVRLISEERDIARRELQFAKNEMEQAQNRIARLEPLAAKAREMAIYVGFRKAFTGSGYVLVIQNKTTRPMSLSVNVFDSTRQRNKQFRVVVDGGTASGGNFQAASPKEIGHLEGWAFASGDSVEVQSSDYDPLRIAVP